MKPQPVLSRFKLNDSTIAEIMQKSPSFGFNGLGEVVFRRTYSRNNESWNDVVIRVIQGTLSVRKEHFSRNYLSWNDEDWQPYARDMALSLFDMEWLPPGRGLWMMGTDFAYNQGSAALNNCAAIDTKDDLVHCAEWTMDFLMNGVGVGFSTSWRGEVTMPDKTRDNHLHLIEDSREGWVNSLIVLMCSYINSQKYGKNEYPLFDYSRIRKEGEPIRGFGGTSSGYKPLKLLHERVDQYLTTFCKGEITVDGVSKPYSHTRLIADIFNAIGACVVSGNVRRSAEICLGDVEDNDFINLKNYTLNPERQDIGWMSNNSVILKAEQNYDDFSYIPEMAKRISENGEPGMINLYNINKYARYGKEKSDSASLVNPCGEIPLCSAEMCNLAETFPPRCANPTRFYKALEFATFYASTVSLLPTHRPETNAIVAKNRRIGVSISGIAQWVSNQSLVASSDWGDMNYTRMTHFLRKGYKIVVAENAKLASLAGVPASIRVTTIKPSGSISLLAGCTPGVHYPVSRFAIRRVRMSKDSPLVPVLKRSGVVCEDDVYSDNTYVFSFAIDHGNVRSSNEVSPWEQFSVVAMLQRCYSDNCVSATIYFDKEKDSPDVEKMLAMYIPILKSVSMMPHSGHGYKQAPYEPITEEEYIKLRDSYKFDFKEVTHNVPEGSSFCASCEI